MPQALEVYAFLDRKQDGVFPVFDTDGDRLASIHTSYWNRDFQVTDPTGQPLCSGSPAFMSRTYTVIDANSAVLLEMRSSFWNGKKRTITLDGGGELVLQGASWPSRDWRVEDATGGAVLTIEATASGWSFHPDAYAVRVGDPGLTLAHVIGIVQVNRMLVKQARSSAAT